MSGMMMAAAAAQKRAPSIDPDAATFIARFTVAPDSPRIAAINNLFIAIKTAGVYAKLNMLFVPKKGQDSQSGLLDLKRHTKAASIVGSASWSSTLGFVGVTGANNYVSSNYTPSTDAADGVTANNFGMGCYMTLAGAVYPSSSTVGLIVAYSSTALGRSALLVQGNEVSNSISSSYVSGSANLVSEVSSNGDPWFYQLNRTAPNSLTAYRNGAISGSNVVNDDGRLLSDADLHFNVSSGNGTTGQPSAIGAVWAGLPLSTTEQSDLKTALDNYFSAL